MKPNKSTITMIMTALSLTMCFVLLAEQKYLASGILLGLGCLGSYLITRWAR